jgi:hypothetical protein
MARERNTAWPATWAAGQSAPRDVTDREIDLERMVSRDIGQMRVIWIDVPDEPAPTSERAYLERNSIGLLSRFNLLMPFKDKEWLGRYSKDWRICVSGLWNLNHVFMRPDDAFLDRLAQSIRAMIGDHPSLRQLPKAARSSSSRQYTMLNSEASRGK